MSNTAETETQTPNALTAAEQKKRELVNFVANNILNSLTMNQTINVVQQVALRDANQIISDADEEKLAEIEAAFDKAVSQATEEQPVEEEKPKAKTGAKAKRSRKKATAA